MKIETLKLWEDREDVELTTFLHIPDDVIPDPIPKPAVVVCPGGAYQVCPRHGNEGDPIAMAFAIDGYQAFVLEYSVQNRVPRPELCRFPAQLIDLGKAILTIRERAKEWYVDADKISVIGFSAGAHLCGMLATTWHEPLLSEHFGTAAGNFRPLSAICIYGLFDYARQNEFNRLSDNMFTQMDLNTHVFGCADPERSEEERNSPCCHVSEKTVPVFMAAAIDDDVVTPMHSLVMAEKLQNAGIPYELHMFQFGGHGFCLGRNIFEPYREERKHACSDWLPLAKKFLMHQISLDTLKYEKKPAL